VKSDIQNIRGLNLAVVELTAIEMTKLPLKHMLGMICPVKPVLTEDLCVVQNEEFSVTCYMCDQKPSIFIRDKIIYSSARMLHKGYYRKSSVRKKKSLFVGLKGPGAKTN
jgi:hypothetical protein